MSEDRLEMRSRRENEEGSIGIGAMIVFIALILVAAVASTIIIKTAEELQQNAEQTSADTRQQISGKVALVDVIIRSTADELGAGGEDHVSAMDIIWRVSSGSTGMYPADVSYYITCEVSSSVGAFYDQGSLDASLISTGVAVAASTELDAGNTYFTTITLGNADGVAGNDVLNTDDAGNGCDALFVQGAEIDMRISVDGGGDTATELKVNSLTAGSSIM